MPFINSFILDLQQRACSFQFVHNYKLQKIDAFPGTKE
jgi:hypothetical protein